MNNLDGSGAAVCNAGRNRYHRRVLTVKHRIRPMASNLPPPPETIETDTNPARCDGGGALGHPTIYIPLGAEGRGECGYCDRVFVLKAGARAAH